MKALIGNAFLIGLAVAAASVAACSSSGSSMSTSDHPATVSNEDGTGSIGLQLTLPGGGVINTISYTVNGPNGAGTIVTTGTVPVGNSTSLFFQTPDNIPAGNGYTITLTGADDAGDTCIGTSVVFSVVARTSAAVLVQLQCHATANGSGSTQVTGVTSNCATWQSVSPATSDIITGVSDPVAFSATGPDHGNLSYTATVTGAGSATISAPAGALTTGSSNTGAFNVTCTSPGAVTVSVVFSDGPLPTGGSCDSTLDTVTFPIHCEGAAIDSGTAPVVDSGTTVVDSGVDSGPAFIDSGVDSGPSIVAQQNAICNTATGTTGGCSSTERAFVQHDPTGVCLNCLVQGGALDDAIFPDTGHECGDLTGAPAAACLATLDCILNTNVGNDNASDTTSPTAPTCADKGNVSDCYCGNGVNTAACAALTAAPTGACTAVEAAGLNLPSFPTTPVLNAYTNVTLGSGLANAMFVTAQNNACTSCF